MQIRQPTWKLLAIVTCLGLVAYGATYVYALRSDGFAFARQWIQKSDEIQQIVGPATEVHLRPFFGYSDESAGAVRKVRMIVDVIGINGSARVDLRVQESSGTWRVIEMTRIR